MSLADDYLTTAQEVTITPSGASNLFGEGAAGSPVAERARVRERRRLVRSATGEEIQSVAEVMLRPGASVAVDDRITYDSRTYPVVAVEPARGLGGEVLHRLAYLGA